VTSDDRADGFAIFTANELHSVVTNSKVFQPTHSILTMMPSSQPISSRKLLLLLSLGTPLLSESYQQHLPELKWGAGALSYAQRDRLSKTSRTLIGRPSASYDLGLGKNQPIKSSKTSKPATKTKTPSVTEAVEYLVEHDGVIDYPSPHRVREQREQLLLMSSSQQSPSTSTQKPTLSYTHQLPRGSLYVVDRSMTSDLDMNTPWVQLLLLEQQQLAILQGATS
jgi:hypothetical protein